MTQKPKAVNDAEGYESQREGDKAKRVQIARCATLGSFFLIINQESNHHTDYHHSYVISHLVTPTHTVGTREQEPDRA
jgi:hypothetical protein